MIVLSSGPIVGGNETVDHLVANQVVGQLRKSPALVVLKKKAASA